MKIALRNYRADDFDTLHRIDQSCYLREIAYSRAELRRYLAFPEANCIVAEIPNNKAAASGQRQGRIEPPVVGFCISIHRGTEGHIITMDVLKEWRRHGVGSTLLGEIEGRLVRAGVNHVELETATDNAPGIAFWRNNGYRPCGLKRGYYPRGVDAYAMVKALAAVRSPSG